jgi:hypothetical protein
LQHQGGSGCCFEILLICCLSIKDAMKLTRNEEELFYLSVGARD